MPSRQVYCFASFAKASLFASLLGLTTLQLDAEALSRQLETMKFGRVAAVGEQLLLRAGSRQLVARVTAVDSQGPEAEDLVGYHCYRGLVTPNTAIYLTADGELFVDEWRCAALLWLRAVWCTQPILVALEVEVAVGEVRCLANQPAALLCSWLVLLPRPCLQNSASLDLRLGILNRPPGAGQRWCRRL